VYLARWSTLIVAALITSPALWHAFVRQDMDYQTALTRFLIAVPVSALMLAVLRGMAEGYRRMTAPRPTRRRDDEADDT
jgi:hypothetical protein